MGQKALLRAEDFFALKNPTASAGFEPANLDTKGQHATSRPPKPLPTWSKYGLFGRYIDTVKQCVADNLTCFTLFTKRPNSFSTIFFKGRELWVCECEHGLKITMTCRKHVLFHAAVLHPSLHRRLLYLSSLLKHRLRVRSSPHSISRIQ